MADEAVAIIHSTNQKAEMTGPPRQIWTSSRFQLYLAHAEFFCSKVFVLSDKYGLIDPDQDIEPYDDNVKFMPIAEQLRWWGRTKQEIRRVCTLQPKIVVLYMGNLERERILREFVRNGVRNVTYPFGTDVGISERLELIYDMEPPFAEDKLQAGEYLLPEDFGAPKKRGRPRKDTEEPAERAAPTEDDIEWEDDDEDVAEAE